MNKKDFKVGQTVWCRLTGQKRGRGAQELIKPFTVTSVGRKYVTIDNGVQFDLQNGGQQKTQYSTDFILYVSKQRALDDLERENLIMWFNQTFHYHNNKFSLKALKEARHILEEE